MNNSTEGHHRPDHLSNRKAGGLLLAFLAAVILVALATMALNRTEYPNTDETMDNSEPWLVSSPPS